MTQKRKIKGDNGSKLPMKKMIQHNVNNTPKHNNNRHVLDTRDLEVDQVEKISGFQLTKQGEHLELVCLVAT